MILVGVTINLFKNKFIARFNVELFVHPEKTVIAMLLKMENVFLEGFSCLLIGTPFHIADAT